MSPRIVSLSRNILTVELILNESISMLSTVIPGVGIRPLLLRDIINALRISRIILFLSFSVNTDVISLNPVSSPKLAQYVKTLNFEPPPLRFTLLIQDSSEMTPVFSGGLVYEWSQETSDYGLVDLGNGTITLLQDYNNLKAEFAENPIPSGDGGYKSNGTASDCPGNSTDFTSWVVLPAMPAGAQQYIDNGAGTALGYNGPTNQGAGSAVLPPFPLLTLLVPEEIANGRHRPLWRRGQVLIPRLHVPVALLVQVEAATARAEDTCYWLRKEVLLEGLS